jgi:hypothetical protein
MRPRGSFQAARSHKRSSVDSPAFSRGGGPCHRPPLRRRAEFRGIRIYRFGFSPKSRFQAFFRTGMTTPDRLGISAVAHALSGCMRNLVVIRGIPDIKQH